MKTYLNEDFKKIFFRTVFKFFWTYVDKNFSRDYNDDINCSLSK